MTPPTSPSRVGPKGRTVIPAAVRRAAGLHEGDEVVTSAVGEGRVLLETVSAVRNRVWAAADGAKTTDAVTDTRAARVEDVELSDAAAARRSAASQTSGTEASQARGQALLAELGLA